MKLAIIGTGRVGSATASILADNPDIDELILINRTKKNAHGLKSDLIAADSGLGSKIIIGDHKKANESDIIIITCGSFGAPSGTSLWDTNKPIIEDIFKKIRPKQDSKIIVITTPCDRTAHLAWKLSGSRPENIIGFGGQLDVNRLKYLIYSDIGDFSKSDIVVNYIGEHSNRGIPIFREEVSDREKIIEHTKNYFGIYLAGYNASTYGTAKELTKLVETLISEQKKILNISYYDPNPGIFITWPCALSKNTTIKPIDLDLTDKEKTEFNSLIKTRIKETDI